MRKFQTIYSELKHYGAFNSNPSTPSQATLSLNCFFEEIKDELCDSDDAQSYDDYVFLLQSYRWNAQQYINQSARSERHDSYKSFLNDIYKTLNGDSK